MEAVWSVYRSTKRTAVDNSEKELACTKTDICSTKESFDTEKLEIIIKLQNNMDCNRESRRENGRFYWLIDFGA